ncbi:MAG: N-acetylmuramidase family protein [Chitinophagaceae bacterium]|nr:N-acetylmuramidase family protein [Chitinophagaceae bacterium]
MNGLLKKGSKGEFVLLMQEMLKRLGYNIGTDGSFGPATEKIVLQFQKDNNLKQDGMVGSKSWVILTELFNKKKGNVAVISSTFMGESDFNAFAQKYNLEPAMIKAVHEVESNGRGFTNGKIKILFEGHIFWKQLKERGIDPAGLTRGNENILYKNYFSPNKYYKEDQHSRLDKAKAIHEEAALCSASYGLFQIMGNNYKDLGYPTAKAMVDYMSQSEANQLDVFGKFIVKNNLINALRSKKWAQFAKGYNGPSYKSNRYDTKMEAAYKKYSKMA